jgi:uncharacterized integral membrane protein
MSDAWEKTKIWTKISVIGLVTIFIILFIWLNDSNTTKVWFFGQHETTVLWILLGAFVAGVLVIPLARPVYRAFAQLAALRKKPETYATIIQAKEEPPKVENTGQ